jgi:nucleoside-triphosphatase THEP1
VCDGERSARALAHRGFQVHGMTKWAAVVGARNSGKTATVCSIVDRLVAGGATVGGVVQQPVQEEAERTGYVAHRVGGQETHVLAWRGPAPPDSRPEARSPFCNFVFDEDGFALAREWIREAVRRCDVVVIDEVSKMEVERRGHHDAVREALNGPAIVLLSIRGDYLFALMEHYELDEPVACLDLLESHDAEAFAADLLRAVGLQ